MGNEGSRVACAGHACCQNRLSAGTATSKRGWDDACVLRPEDPHRLPEGLRQRRLLLGALTGEAWGRADLSCVILGRGGAMLGLVGPGGLLSADGVSLDCIDGGVEVLALSLSKLHSAVRGLVFVVSPGEDAEELGFQQGAQAERSATAFIAEDCPPSSGGGGAARGAACRGKVEEAIETTPVDFLQPICKMPIHPPDSLKGLGMVLFALSLTGPGTEWQVAGVGKPIAVSGASQGTLEDGPSEGVPLASQAARCLRCSASPLNERPPRPLPWAPGAAAPALPGRAAQSAPPGEQSEDVHHLVHGLRNEVAQLRKQMYFYRNDVSAKIAEFEAWRKEALIHAQARDLQKLESMLASTWPIDGDRLKVLGEGAWEGTVGKCTSINTVKSFKSYALDAHKEETSNRFARGRDSRCDSAILEDLPDGARQWSVSDVGKWLRATGLREGVEEFESSQVDGKQLLALTWGDLLKFGGMTDADRMLVAKEISILRFDEEQRRSSGARGEAPVEKKKTGRTPRRSSTEESRGYTPPTPRAFSKTLESMDEADREVDEGGLSDKVVLGEPVNLWQGLPDLLHRDFREWTPVDVARWLNGIGVMRAAPVFQRYGIDGERLHRLTFEELQEMVELPFVDRMRILKEKASLKLEADPRKRLRSLATMTSVRSGSTMDTLQSARRRNSIPTVADKESSVADSDDVPAPTFRAQKESESSSARITFNINEPIGALFDAALAVSDVIWGSQAARCGVKLGWHARAFDGDAVFSISELESKMQEVAERGESSYEVLFVSCAARAGSRDWDITSMPSMSSLNPLASWDLGAPRLSLMTASLAVDEPFGVLFDDACVAKAVQDRSQAAEAGITEGWQVQLLEGEPIGSVDDMKERINSLRLRGVPKVDLMMTRILTPRGERQSPRDTASIHSRGSSKGSSNQAVRDRLGRLFGRPSAR